MSEPITVEERASLMDAYSIDLDLSNSSPFGDQSFHERYEYLIAYEARVRQLEEENKRLSALLHEACKMLATLGDQMHETAEDKFEIEEFQARARKELGE